MAFFGVFLKPAIARERARQTLQQLDLAIAEAERQRSLPLLDGLTGAERFHAAAVLLEATLLARAGAGDPAERGMLVESYIRRMEEEYQMAAKDLKQLPATRAEVVALGIALKEVALSLDGEIAGFRTRGAGAIQEVRQAVDSARGDLRRHVDAEGKRLDGVVQEGLARLGERAEAKVSEASQDLRIQIRREFEEAREHHEGEIGRLVASARELVAGVIEEKTAAAVGELASQLQALDEQHREALRVQNEQSRESVIAAVLAEMHQRWETLAKGVKDAGTDAELTQLVSTVNSRLADLSAELAGRIEAAKAEEGQRLDGMQSRLENTAAAHDQRLQDLGKTLESRIAELGFAMDHRVDGLSAELTGRIETVRAEEELRLNGMQSRLEITAAAHDQRLRELGDTLESRIAGLSSATDDRIEGLSADLTARMETARAEEELRLNGMQSRLEITAAAHDQRLRELGDTVESRIAELSSATDDRVEGLSAELTGRMETARAEEVLRLNEMQSRLEITAAAHDQRLGELREAVDTGLAELATDLTGRVETLRRDDARERVKIRSEFEERSSRQEQRTAELAATVDTRITDLSNHLADQLATARVETGQRFQAASAELKRVAGEQQQAVASLAATTERNLEGVRETLVGRIQALDAQQRQHLEELRATRDDLRSELAESARQLTAWLYGTLAVSALGVVLAVVALASRG